MCIVGFIRMDIRTIGNINNIFLPVPVKYTAPVPYGILHLRTYYYHTARNCTVVYKGFERVWELLESIRMRPILETRT